MKHLFIKGHKHSEETKRKIGLANSIALKGKHPSEETRKKLSLSHKGNTNTLGMHWKMREKTKKRIGFANKGNGLYEKNANWKGDKIGCGGVHTWIRRHHGNPTHCEDCGLEGRKINGRWNIDWSSIDHNYTRNKEDYIGRCQKCHKKYDYILLKVKEYGKSI